MHYNVPWKRLWQQPGMNCNQDALLLNQLVPCLAQLRPCLSVRGWGNVRSSLSRLSTLTFIAAHWKGQIMRERETEPKRAREPKSQTALACLNTVLLQNDSALSIWILCWEPKKVEYLRCEPTPHFNEPWTINYELWRWEAKQRHLNTSVWTKHFEGPTCLSNHLLRSYRVFSSLVPP